jgi:hypothetical protein
MEIMPICSPVPLCLSCMHFLSIDSLGFRCKAFKYHIPDEIKNSLFDHKKNHPLDNGLTYQPKPKVKE